jgi:hypothetical protein
VGFTAAALDTGVLVLTCAVQGILRPFMSIYAVHVPFMFRVYVDVSVCTHIYHGLVCFRAATAAAEHVPLQPDLPRLLPSPMPLMFPRTLYSRVYC